MKNKKLRIAAAVAAVILVIAAGIFAFGGGRGAKTFQEQLELGQRYLAEMDYEQAVVAFTAAIEIEPNQAGAYIGRGNAYILSGETEEHLA